MSAPIGLGIIGLGAMGCELLDAAAGHPDYSVRLAADISAEQVSRAKIDHPQITFTTSPLDVIDSKEVEAVYIATPPTFHADYAVRAMRQGKAVFCEKPLAVDRSDGERMVEIAGETGVPNAINFALADRNAVLEVDRALEAGEIGEVRGVDVRLLFPKWPRDFQSDSTWLAGREQGGFTREVLSHFAYLTDRLLGPLTPTLVWLGHAPADEQGSEVAALGLLMAGDVSVRVTGQVDAAVPETYEWCLYGSRRSYCLRNWGDLLVCEADEWRDVSLDGERGSEFTRLTAFARAIRGQTKTELPDFAVGLRVQSVIEAFHVT